MLITIENVFFCPVLQKVKFERIGVYSVQYVLC